jgi:hypothetical protein
MTEIALTGAHSWMPPALRGPMGIAMLVVGIGACVVLKLMSKKWEANNNSVNTEDAMPRAVGQPWQCPKCGENLESQFELCWKCGTARVLAKNV